MNEKRGTFIQIGDTIRLLRQQRQWTMEQLAERSGVSLEALDHYESHVWRPGAEMAGRLAAALGITTLELANGFSILYEMDQKALLVSHLGDNRIRVIGRIESPEDVSDRQEENNHG